MRKTRSGVHWLVALTIGLGVLFGSGLLIGHAQEDATDKLTPAQTKAIEFYNLKVKPIRCLIQ